MGNGNSTHSDAPRLALGDEGRGGDDAAPGQAVWHVLIPLPLPGPLDYLGPDDLCLGTVVEVPLGGRLVVGVVWGAGTDQVPVDRLRPIARVFDVPPLPPISRRFVDWVAPYTLSPAGAVLKLCLSAPAALEPEGQEMVVGLAAIPSDTSLKWTAARRRVVDTARDLPPLPAPELARLAGCGVSVVHGLVAAGVLVRTGRDRMPPPRPADPDHAGPTLSDEQADAADRLCAMMAAGRYAVTLLDGVTGSGKTNVYFEAIAAALRDGRQVLVLLPEIALTAQWLDRFAARFGTRPSEWHSRLTGRSRRRTWRAVADGTAGVVVGARSALFLPFTALGLIIVDEEHDPAFKQEDGVLYHARDMAVARAFLDDIPVVLASATPSLETVVNVDRGRYAKVALPDRFGGARLPDIRAVDLRETPPERGTFLAPSLIAEALETLARGEQVLLFMNRRGYAPLTLCRACGHRLACPDCDAWLVEHRLARRLICHHCDHREPIPVRCPACGAPDALTAIGPGVERIAEEVAARFPEARTLILTSDQLHGTADLADKMDRIRDGAVDIVIGTQLIAKGHHFPGLTLVGVVDADLGQSGGDLRAAERTYQLLAQVAGRAGRGDRPGHVRLQTYDPDQPVLAALLTGDRDAFLAAEAAERARRDLPPFGRLAGIIVSAPSAEAADAAASALARARPAVAGVEVLGPAEAPLAVLQRRHRRRFLVKAPRGIRLQPIVADWLGRVRLPQSIRIKADIDPYSFL